MATITIGANSYDAIESVANAEIYFGGRMDAAEWDALGADPKKKVLVTASRMLGRQKWAGDLVVSSQPLAWPRINYRNRNGLSVVVSTTPADVINGFYELALALAKDASAQDDSLGGSNVKSLSAGGDAVEFFRSGRKSGRFPSVAQELLGFYLWRAQNVGLPVAYGIEKESMFERDNGGDDDNAYFDLSESLP